MTLKVNELEKVLNLLISELKKHNGNEIQIDKEDYYWSIKEKELYNPYTKPKELTIGQISEDLEHINKLAVNKTPERSASICSWIKIDMGGKSYVIPDLFK